MLQIVDTGTDIPIQKKMSEMLPGELCRLVIDNKEPNDYDYVYRLDTIEKYFIVINISNERFYFKEEANDRLVLLCEDKITVEFKSN